MVKISSQEILFFNISGIAGFISLWLYSASWLNNKLNFLRKLGSFFLFASLLSLTVALVFRGLALKFFPLTNLYESLVIFGWAVILLIFFWSGNLKSVPSAGLSPGFCLLYFYMQAGCQLVKNKLHLWFLHCKAIGV